jgi:Chlorophyll A-B binding protein
MKSVIAFSLLTSATAFNAFVKKPTKAAAPAKPVFSVDSIPGALPPVGLFDPLGFAAKADEKTLRRYREAEVTHGRVAMLATVGFLVGEAVEGSSFLFDSQISGPGITHLSQVPPLFWVLLTVGIGASEQKRAEIGWVDPAKVPVAQPGLLREDYTPGDIGFDPLNLKPEDPAKLFELQTKELQNGRLAMLAVAGFVAQECVDGKGILEHFSS